MVHLSIIALTKALSLTMKNMVQNNLSEEIPVGLGLNFAVSPLSEEYLLHKEPYCGADTDLLDTGLSQGGNIVLGLNEKCELKARSTVTFDNLFTSLPLLDELTELGIGALCTLRQNRFHVAPVANKTTLAKKPRGSYDFPTNGKNLVMSWLITKLLLVPPTTLPVILPSLLNGG